MAQGSERPRSGYSFCYTYNGWRNDFIGFEWLQNHFGKFTLPSAPERTRLLLCDNRSSHDTLEFYEYCFVNSIALLLLPSHVLQLLDVGVFAPLDRHCS